MAQKKNFYYVMVMTNDGPVFVTSVENATKWAHWDKDEKPLELGKYWAEDLALGLNLNGHQAYVVSSKWEHDAHPYLYSMGHFDWTWDNK